MTVDSNPKREPSRKLVLIRMIATAALTLTLASSFTAVNLANAQDYDELSPDQQTIVETRCLPIQYTDGAAAFRECVIEQSDKLADATVPTQTGLTFDEQFAVQQQCQINGNPGTERYQQCASEQINSLQGMPTSDFSQVTEDEKFAVVQGCYAVQTTGGVKAYRDCINTSLRALATIPRPDLSTLSLIDKNALQLRCSANHEEAASYRSCLLDAVNGASAIPAQPVAETVTDNTSSDVLNETQAVDDSANLAVSPVGDNPTDAGSAINDQQNQVPDTSPLETDAVEQPVTENLFAAETEIPEANEASTSDTTSTDNTTPGEQITDPVTIANAQNSLTDSVDTVTPEARIDTPVVEPTELTASDLTQGSSAQELPSSTNLETALPQDANTLLDKILAAAGNLWPQLQSSIQGLSGMNRIVALSALALPLCLAGFWLLMRGRRSPEPEYQPAPYPNPLIDRVGPSQQRRERTIDDSDIATHVETQDFAEQVSELFADEKSEQTPSYEPAQRTAAAATETTRFVEPAEAVTREMAAGQVSAAPADRGEIVSWLNEHEAEARLSLAIEYMIYWTAYADERYDPGLKEKIFALKSPDDHDLIKRWVLKQDVQAFADVTQWLQSETSLEQREQILKLLMALLVSENAMTPAQNTLLRFLGDAYGTGNERLNELHQQGYGTAMPPLPRADKPHWWDQQSLDDLKRWDARSVSRQTEEIQFRVKLGLPLNGELSSDQIDDHYRRAAARCNPQHVELLTRRELLLLDRQLAKFERARDALEELVT